jgi:hypothetical protein
LRLYRTNAFTTVELLMTLALMALLAAAVFEPGNSIFAGLGDEPLDETLRKAVREARYQAVDTGSLTVLSWDVETGEFVIRNAMGEVLERMKSDARGENDDVKFYRIESTQGDEIPEGEPTLEEAASVKFDADRCATPLVAKVHYAGKDMSIRYDPFSNLKLETPE